MDDGRSEESPGEVLAGESLAAEVLAAEVAAVLHPRIAELTADLQDRLSSRIEELDGDTQLLDLLYASIEGNIENILYSVRHGVGTEKVEPPSAAYEYARRLAQRGVEVSALVRAYRLGQQRLLELLYAECGRLGSDAGVAAAAYQHIVTVTFDYIDWMSLGVVGIYEAERERWLVERSSARAGLVEDLVAGESVDVDETEATIGYRLRVPHLGLVLWVHETGAQQDQISRFNRAAAAIAELLGSTRAPLVIPRDRASAWAWIAVPAAARVDLAAIGAVLNAQGGPPVPVVALGSIESGIEGFRRTHLQAVQAQRVAMIRDDPTHAVIGYDEAGLTVAALLARDLDATRAWTQEVLGELAADDEHAERLRHTLLLFFQCDSSYTATAERMVMHKNSVKYRIASAEKALGRPISTDRQAIELALTACHWLGPAMLVRGDRA